MLQTRLVHIYFLLYIDNLIFDNRLAQFMGKKLGIELNQ